MLREAAHGHRLKARAARGLVPRPTGCAEISADGKIDADLVKRLIIFSIDNGLGQKEKMPAAGELYTKEFTG